METQAFFDREGPTESRKWLLRGNKSLSIEKEAKERQVCSRNELLWSNFSQRTGPSECGPTIDNCSCMVISLG